MHLQMVGLLGVEGSPSDDVWHLLLSNQVRDHDDPIWNSFWDGSQPVSSWSWRCSICKKISLAEGMFLLLEWESIPSKVRCFRENEEAQMIPCDQRMVMGWWSQPHQSWRWWRRVERQRSNWWDPRRRRRWQRWFKNIWDLLVSWIRWRSLQK